MDAIWLPILGLMLLLTIAVLLVPLAARLNFPHTVLLAAVGVLLGILASHSGLEVAPGPAGDAIRALKGLNITAEMVLFLFLPALVFESAMSIDVRRLMDDVGPILFLAVVGLLISTLAVGAVLYWSSGMALVVCMLLGCIVSATDPVAVVALFKELGAPKRLTILVEGESLFNDATAIVLYSILLSMVVGAGELDLLAGSWDFLRVFVGGVIVGFLIARLVTALLERLRRLTLVCITLTIALAYLAFIIAEHYLHVSGVMAVVTAGLVVGSTGRTVIPPEGFHALHETWGQLGFWANSIIFVLVGLAVPGLLAEADASLYALLAALIAVATVARAAVIFGLVPLVSRLGVAQSVSPAFQAVMLWGGLRGAVSLALALAIVENEAVAPEVRQFIAVLVTGFVLFTLFFQATTIRALMSWLGLDQLAPAERAIRDRAVAQTMQEVSSGVAEAVADQEVDPALGDRLCAAYRQRASEASDQARQVEDLSAEEWRKVGLATFVAQEKHRYFEQFGDGFVPAPVLRELLVRVDDIADALKARGAAAFPDAVAESLAFDRRFMLALQVQRRSGWQAPLAKALRLRFEMLTAMRTAIREELEHGEAGVRALVGDEAGDDVVGLLRDRLDQVNLNLTNIRLQYPDYAQAVEEQRLGRVALRLEERDYRHLYEQALISADVYSDLQAGMEARRRQLDQRPALDLGLEPERLIRAVPFLADLPDERVRELAGRMRPVLATPGETVIRRGDAGDRMYFVSNGSVQVDLDSGPVQLGSGDIFGEIALLVEQPRNADVHSTGFSQLLTLHRRDFLPFLDAHPDLKRKIEALAAERLKAEGLAG